MKDNKYQGSKTERMPKEMKQKKAGEEQLSECGRCFTDIDFKPDEHQNQFSTRKKESFLSTFRLYKKQKRERRRERTKTSKMNRY